MARRITLTDHGELIFNELRTNGLDGVTVTAPASLAASYGIELPDALPGSAQFLTLDNLGKLALSVGSTASLDAGYDSGGAGAGRIITADSGPVEAAGAGGFLASHSAPVYGLETTGAELNYRLTAGQAAGIFEIQVGDADGDISDDTFSVGLALDGTNLRWGVGTAAPATLAHLLAPAATDAKLTIQAPATFDASVIFNEDSTARWEVGYDDSAAGLVVGRLSFANPVLFLEDTTGDVGIGETTPDARLHVTSAAALVALAESAGAAARLGLRGSGTTNENQVGVQATADNLELFSNGAISLTIGATGSVTPAGGILTVAGQVFVDQNANALSIVVDSEATGQPLIDLRPLNANTRGDIAFGTARTADPATPSEGDLWFESTNDRVNIANAAGNHLTLVGSHSFWAGRTSAPAAIVAGVATLGAFGIAVIAAETGTADDLDTITATSAHVNDTMIVRADAGDTITVKHGTGNISLDGSADKALVNGNQLSLVFNGSTWQQLTPMMVLP